MSRHVMLVAEPGLSYTLAKRAANEIESDLAEAFAEPIEVSVDSGALLLDDDGEVHLSRAAAPNDDDSDLALFFTELPRLWRGSPTPAEIDTNRLIGIISVPACGSFALRRRVARLTVACAAGLLAPDNHNETFRSVESRHRRWHINEKSEGYRTLVGSTWGEWPRMLMGMLRVNRPWRLVYSLKGVIAAATATASFGIFYTSIWQMAIALPSWRLALITVSSIAVMSTWLIVANQLWERRNARPFSASRKRMFNAVTVLTVLTGVVIMYAVLYLLIFVGGLVIIDAGFMSQKIGKPASVMSFLSLAWLASSMGVVAGALGSNSDSHDAILRATYGHRERERRLQQDDDADGRDANGTSDPT